MGTPRVIEFLMSGVVDSAGSPLVGGKVFTYTPGTTLLKSTWQDFDQVSAHANPIILDAQGAKQVFASGSYDIVIKNAAETETLYTYESLYYSGNDGAEYYGGVATGTANALEITVPLALDNPSTGSLFSFVAGFTNTSSATISINGAAALSIYDNTTGAALVGGEITAGRFYIGAIYGGFFQLLNPLSGVWTTWSPTLTGFSADPTSSVYRYKKIGRTVHLVIRQGSAGTSNSTSFTISLPFTAATIANMQWINAIGYSEDNGARFDGAYCSISSAGTVLNLFTSTGKASAWTAASTKRANCEIIYEAAS